MPKVKNVHMVLQSFEGIRFLRVLVELNYDQKIERTGPLHTRVEASAKPPNIAGNFLKTAEVVEWKMPDGTTRTLPLYVQVKTFQKRRSGGGSGK